MTATPAVHVDVHDPLCPRGGFLSEPDDCRVSVDYTLCDLIRMVRADEAQKVEERLYESWDADLNNQRYGGL